MPNFDLRTIIFMSMLMTFMVSMMLAITRTHYKEVRGPGYWAVGNLLIGLGMILLLMQIESPKSIFLPGLALVGAGLSLYLNGIQAFLTDSPNHRITIAVFVVLVALEAYFMLVSRDIRTLFIVGSVVFSAIYFLSARAAFGKDKGVIGSLLSMTAILFIFMSLLMLARATSALSLQSATFSSFVAWPSNGYTLMLATVSQLFVSGLFAFMLSYKLNRNLASIATMDGLTSILNRRGLEDSAQKLQGICKRINLGMSVLMIDIDHFKKINDQHGHLTGDEMLRSLTKVITALLRAGDVFGRYGGEEFCVFLPNTTEAEAAGLAERIRAGVAASKLKENQATIRATVSIGVADSIGVGYDFTSLVSAADNALYIAKRTGRNRVVRHTTSTAQNKFAA